MNLAIFKTSKVSGTFEGWNTRSDEIPAETGDVFVRFQNSTSWQSWHSSAHACTSSWLTNAVRDAPVASVKVMVSASCLRGKRPSASSKLLRYLESQPMRYFPYPGVSSEGLLKLWTNKTTHQKENTFIYYSWKLCLVCTLHPISVHVALTFVSTRLIWGSRLSPDQFDVWINEEAG